MDVVGRQERTTAPNWAAKKEGGRCFARLVGCSTPSPPATTPSTSSTTASRPLINMADDTIEALPPSKIGEYKVISEIAEGTFGKVKSTWTWLVCAPYLTISPRIFSGNPRHNTAEGRHEVSVEGGDHSISNKDKSSARSGVHASATTPSHHQTVRFYTPNRSFLK